MPEQILIVRDAEGADTEYVPKAVYDRVVAALQKALSSYQIGSSTNKPNA